MLPTLPTPRRSEEAFSDRDLVACMRAGDPLVWESVFTQHYAQLVQFASSYVARPIAEDLAQDVFLAIWQNRERWNPEGGIRAYLFAAVRNRALKSLERSAVARKTARKSGPSAVSSTSIEDVEKIVRAQFDDMPERNRVVFLLRWTIGMKDPEIAFVLGKTIDGVEKDEARGLRWLARRLGILRK